MTNWKNRIVDYGTEDPEQLLANPFNARIHPQAQQDGLQGVLDTVGWVDDVIVNRVTGHVVDGHLRVLLAMKHNEGAVPVKYVELTEHEEKLVLAAFDWITSLAVYDRDQLDTLLKDVQTDDTRLQSMLSEMAAANGLYEDIQGGADSTGAAPEQARKTLAERFIIPPFSVLDARQGYWQERKRAWLALGIQSEIGRGENALHLSDEARTDGLNHYRIKGRLPADSGGQPLPLDRTKNGKSPARKFAQDLMRGEHVVGETNKPVGRAAAHEGGSGWDGTWVKRVLGEDYTGLSSSSSGTSIFDPVLCELAYRWFSPLNGSILDPFAGGSVRGIVAALTGRHYTGIDLRAEQTVANQQQAAIITPDNAPRWITGDSRNIAELAPGMYDLIFTCPPYFDLEIYSDDTQDLSNAGDYAALMADYRGIIKQCVAMLNNHRFACIVVGDIRDKRGHYRNFVSDTIAAFIDAGMALYNEAILVTAAGSLPIRVGGQFSASRKLGKTHQNVLVFVKGDAKQATADCGEVEVFIPDSETDSGDDSAYGERLIVS